MNDCQPHNRNIQMQSIISEVQHLNRQVLQQNNRLLQLLRKLSSTVIQPIRVAKQWPHSSNSSKVESNNSKLKHSAKEDLDPRASRHTSQTVKNQSGPRCQSCESIKNSRHTQKTLSRNRLRISETRHESNMKRLQKICQKVQPKVGKQLLVKKKSKIFHFKTYY